MKQLLAGVTALTASAACIAQASPDIPSSHIKVYGVADVGVAHYRTSGEAKTAMHTAGSGSRIGFLSTEDLGGGWKAGARLEAGVNLDTGTSSSTNGNPNRVFSRQAYAELGSDSIGVLRFGRQQGPAYQFFGTYDPMLLPAMDAWGVLTTLGAGAPGTPSRTGVSTGFLINPTQRTENTISYISPRLGGVQGQLSYSLHEDSATIPKFIEAGVDYVSGPFTIGALFVRASSTPGTGAVRPTDSVGEMAIGVKYQAGPIQPYVSYIRRDATDPTLGAGGSVLNGRTETVKLIGAVIPVSERGALRMTYGRYSSGTADRDATNYGFAYTYDLSRSLMLMAAFTRLTQDGSARWPVFQSPAPDAGKAVNAVLFGGTWRF